MRAFRPSLVVRVNGSARAARALGQGTAGLGAAGQGTAGQGTAGQSIRPGCGSAHLPWVKIDDGAAEHPKVQALSNGAFRVWFAGLCYCNRRLSDGHIEEPVAAGLAFQADRSRWEALLEELCTAPEGFASSLWEKTPTGYRVHDYLDYQPTRKKVLAERAAARRRMRKVRAGSRSGERSGEHRGSRSGERSVEPPAERPRNTAAGSAEVPSQVRGKFRDPGPLPVEDTQKKKGASLRSGGGKGKVSKIGADDARLAAAARRFGGGG